jgi:transketolase
MRNRFAEEANKLARTFDDVVLLYGDIGNRLFDNFKKEHPGRSFNCGVAEANMVGVSAGLAKTGFTPIVYTINTFLYLRAFEQIKLDICYPEVPVILVGTGSGLSYSELGSTHHSLEDLGVLRQLPNIQIFAPTCPSELAEILFFAYLSKKPTYIRIGKKGEGEVKKVHSLTDDKRYFGPFVASMHDTCDSVVISCGTISENVEKAIENLTSSGVKVDHLIQPQISPINLEATDYVVAKYKKIITVEEHNSVGALSAIYSTFISSGSNQNILHAISIPSTFHVGLGSLEEARESFGLDVKSLEKKIASLLVL